MEPSQTAIDYLVTSLTKKSFPGDTAGLLHNLVYYTPRIRSRRQLVRIVGAILHSPLWNVAPEASLAVYDMAQAIFEWKLQVSEPLIPVGEFYHVWDQAVEGCSSWSLAQLAILAGILTTRDRFEQLQAVAFVDDSGAVSGLYVRWRRERFVPIWTQMVARNLANTVVINHLSLLYSTVHAEGDSGMPWDVLAHSLFELAMQHVKTPGEATFVARHLNKIAGALRSALPHTPAATVSKVLGRLCQVMFELSTAELNNGALHGYSAKRYSDTLFTVVLLLQGCLSHRAAAAQWYHQTMVSLFFLNFIAQDFGTVGFEAYQYVYELSLTGVTASFSGLSHCYDVMRGNVWPVRENKANDSRALFMLSFMERALPLVPLPRDFIDSAVTPTVTEYIHSPCRALMETAHTVQLSLFANTVSDSRLTQWKLHNLQPYIELSTGQFLGGKLSSKQLLLVFQTVAHQFPYLSAAHKDLSRELLHYTYLQILNCGSQDKKSTLVECLMHQLWFVNARHLVDWLDTCLELIGTCPDKEPLLDELWDIVANAKSDTARHWWYSRVLPVQSKL